MKIFNFSHIFGFCLLVLTGLCPLLSYTEETASAEPTPVSESQESPDLNEEQKDEMTEFLIKEVIPAFEGLKHFQLNNPPSFHLHFTPSGIQLKNCSLSFQIQQLESIQYNLARLDLHDFQADAHIGQPQSFLFFDIECGDQSAVINGYHFKADVSIKDKNLKPFYYGINVHSLDQEQVSLKIWSINIDVKIQNDTKWTLFDSQNNVVLLDSLKDDSNVPLEILEEKSTTDSYSISQEIWPYPLPNTDTVQVTKAQAVQMISLEGVIRLSLPTSVNGQRQETEISIPVTGNIFAFEEENTSDNQEKEVVYIPNINFSTQQTH